MPALQSVPYFLWAIYDDNIIIPLLFYISFKGVLSILIWDFKNLEQTALIQDTGESVTYGELLQFGRQIADQIPSRCLVFSLCMNSIGSVAGYVGFLNHGIVPLLLSSGLDRSMLWSLIDLYKPSFIWAPAKMKVHLAGKEVFASFGYTLIQTDFKQSYPLHPDLALLLTTSGSTGSPKLVRQSFRNLRSNMKAIAEYLELDDTERPITTLPMHYTYGLSVINSHLYSEATILLTNRGVIEKAFWDFFREKEATSLGGVPFLYDMLDRLGFFNQRLPSLRTMTQSGGKLSVELHQKFAGWAKEKRIRFVVMYGATEATARMAYLPPDKAAEKCGSIGIAIPGGKLYLESDDGERITEPDVVGNLIYEGDNVTLGYAASGADLTKGDEHGSRLKTGDLAKFDEDGYFYIAGRNKRFLKIFGNRVNLDEMESLVMNCFRSLDCACTGKDDHMQVFIAGEGNKSEVRKFLAEKTGLNQAAFHVVTLDSIPRNESEKTLYSQLQRHFQP